MPYYSDHYYGSGQPTPYYLPSSPYTPATSRISSPYSFSYMSPISAMLSAGIGTNPLPRGLRSYSPMLSSISESGSPLISRRDLGSPRHISGKTYYRQPRPVVIDTENIDVSRRKHDEINNMESTPGLISRGKTIVRMHTKKLKENPELKKKKTQAELLMEKYLIKEKPKEEIPRRKRIWEEREEELSKTPAQAGTIKRTNTVHRKMSGQLPTPENIDQEEIKESLPQRKTSIDSDLLKAEAALFDCMIQEELGLRSQREISDDKNIEKGDSNPAKRKTKREFLPYGKKKSSHLLLDENGLPVEKKKSHLHKKRSSRNLPLDEANSDENLKEGNTAQDETDTKVIKRRSTKKMKNLSGPLKFKIDALHVEEKSSPKLLRKFQYEVIVEEGDRKSVKQCPQKTEIQFDKSINENIPDILRKEPLNYESKENIEMCDKTSSANSDNIANIRLMSKACDSGCDNKSISENVLNSTGVTNKAIICDKDVTQSVTVKTDERKENSSLKNTEEYMNKFKIKGFLEKQQKQEKEADNNKTSPIFDKRKNQKTDSIKPENEPQKHSKNYDNTADKKTVVTGEKDNSGVELFLNTDLKTIGSEVDHSIEPCKENNISTLNINQQNEINDSKTILENQKLNLSLSIEQPVIPQQNFSTSEVDKKILINVTPSTPVSPDEKQVLQSQKNTELKDFEKKKFIVKSNPNTPILQKRQVDQSSSLGITDTDRNVLRNKLPKSHPNTPLMSKKETMQDNKEPSVTGKLEIDQASHTNNLSSKSNTSTPILQRKHVSLEDSQQKQIGSPELDKKIKPNKMVNSKPNTPILQKKGTFQTDQEHHQLGTPNLERKCLNKDMSGSDCDGSSSMEQKLENLESYGLESIDKNCKSSSGTPFLQKKEIITKTKTAQPKIGTPVATKRFTNEETTYSNQNIPIVLKKDVLEKEVEAKISSPDFDKKRIVSEIPKSKPNTPVLSKKEVKSEDSVQPKVETPSNEFDPWKIILSENENKYENTRQLTTESPEKSDDTSKCTSSATSMNKKDTVQENTDQVKSETPNLLKKKIGHDKPKSSPCTPVKKKEITPEISTHKTTDEIGKNTVANVAKSSPSTPVLQKKGNTTDETPEIGRKTEANVNKMSNSTTPILENTQIIQGIVKPKFGTPELGRKFITNATPKSDPSTPVFTKKQLPQESSPLILQQKFGTPELGRKKLVNEAPKSDPCTPVMSKKQIVGSKIDLQIKASMVQSDKKFNSSESEKCVSDTIKNIPIDKNKIDKTDMMEENSSVSDSTEVNNSDTMNDKQKANAITEIHTDEGGQGNINFEHEKRKILVTKQEDITTSVGKEITKQGRNADIPVTKEKAAPSKVEGLKNVFSKTGKVEESVHGINNTTISNTKSQDSTDSKELVSKSVPKPEGKIEKLVKDGNALLAHENEEKPTSVKKLIKQNAIDERSEKPLVKDRQDQEKLDDKNIKPLSHDNQLQAKVKHIVPTQTKPTENIKTALNHDKPIELISRKGEIDQPNISTSNLELSSKVIKENKEVAMKKESPKKELIEVKESRKKRIKSESDVPEDIDTQDGNSDATNTERKGSKTIEKSKSLDETKTEKSSKKKKKSKDKGSGKKGNSKSPKKLKDVKQSSLDVKEIIQEKKSQHEAQKQIAMPNNTGSSSVNQSEDKGSDTKTVQKTDLSKSELRLLHFINKCIRLSADNENISVDMSDEDESSSSDYTSDSDSEYTSDSEEDTLTDDSSEDDGSTESRDHGSPTRRHSNAALSLDEERSYPGRVTPPATTIPKFRKYALEDFQFLKVLGKGSFGKVLLAELRGTQYYYAVKCLKKDVVLEDDDVECTLIERKVLALGTNHPYLCHLFCTFQTDSHLFFVMEYLNGGDLMFHIQQQGRFDEGRARFYAAEIVSGLKFLHKKGIVYRDLKLDNILLDFDGHVRIADFGMCKLQIFLDRTADTFCGTPDYMAPEIIKGLKYNQCVDWWSFGILLYEMLVGQSPFSGCDEDDLFWCICNRQPHYPRFITLEAKRILCQLLEKEATKRLGSCENGAEEVMGHPFFNGLDWGRLERRDLMPPFKPNVKHPLDVHYFDKHFTAERACLTPIDPSILQSMDQTQFQGFSYTNPNVTE
uniref:Protein kinase domain-containing protein n=1 Tax=Cuerna arida TaxID=1464854 RepID=A0A1B6EZ22_9HEMI